MGAPTENVQVVDRVYLYRVAVFTNPERSVPNLHVCSEVSKQAEWEKRPTFIGWLGETQHAVVQTALNRVVPVIDTCSMGHRFAKLPDHPVWPNGRAQCPHCIVLEKSQEVEKSYER